MVKKMTKTLEATPVIENPKPPGPMPERVKIEGDWGEALKKALGKKRPAEGWPQERKPKKPR